MNDMTPERAARVKAVITAALKESRKTDRSRTHPAIVTAARLADALNKWPGAFDGAARDEVGHLVHILNNIAAGVEN